MRYANTSNALPDAAQPTVVKYWRNWERKILVKIKLSISNSELTFFATQYSKYICYIRLQKDIKNTLCQYMIIMDNNE